MRTGRSLTIFQSLLLQGGVLSPGEMYLVPGGPIWSGGPCLVWGGVLSGTPLCEQNERQVSQYYLGHNFVAAGKNSIRGEQHGRLHVNYKLD